MFRATINKKYATIFDPFYKNKLSFKSCNSYSSRSSKNSSSRLFNSKPLALTAGALALSSAAYYLYNSNGDGLNSLLFNKATCRSETPDNEKMLHTFWSPPKREHLMEQLKDSNKEGQEFDLLVIGGGATGTGVVLDAITRGLKVALVERDDFGSGTSSRSTKLVHGGVRYLEKAVKNLDIEQYQLVKEALRERSTFIKIAPYLGREFPIMVPIYKWWQVPYYWVGTKAYDLLAGSQKLKSSYYLPKEKALESFPMLKPDDLVGAMVYYDAQHNDTRMNIALALTSIYHGAATVNHTEVTKILKKQVDGKEVCAGATVVDKLTGETFDIKAKGVINATGPFTDSIRSMDDGTCKNIVSPSAGVHIILPSYYSPANMGLIDPATSDGRVIFFLPWQGNVIAGTTDSPTEVTDRPVPSEEEITWILDEIRRYLDPEIKIRRGDVLAAWSGIRPLICDPNSKNTSHLVRNHLITVSKNDLITIAGGKWTTYRAMAEETIDKAIELFDLKPTSGCRTADLKLIGTHGYSTNMYMKLIQNFGLETEVAKHLANNYGDRSWGVAALAKATGQRWPQCGERLSPSYPILKEEVMYAMQNEYARTTIDVVANRTRLAFLNAQACYEALPEIINTMAKELNWDQDRKIKEHDEAYQFLLTMGLPRVELQPVLSKNAEVKLEYTTSTSYSRAQFKPEELEALKRIFSQVDKDQDGHINKTDINELLSKLTQLVVPLKNNTNSNIELQKKRFEQDVKETINTMDLKDKNSVEFYEFLDIVSEFKEKYPNYSDISFLYWQQYPNEFPTERSGGGI